MKKNVIKTTVAAVCLVAAGFGGVKAYNAANQSEADLLLAENVEALTQDDVMDQWVMNYTMVEWILNNTCKSDEGSNCSAYYNGVSGTRQNYVKEELPY